METLLDDKKYQLGVDTGKGKDVVVEDHFLKPSAEYPDGSWMHKVDGEVQVATGHYATLYPNKESPYWHDGPPFVVVDTNGWKLPWEENQ